MSHTTVLITAAIDGATIHEVKITEIRGAARASYTAPIPIVAATETCFAKTGRGRTAANRSISAAPSAPALKNTSERAVRGPTMLSLENLSTSAAGGATEVKLPASATASMMLIARLPGIALPWSPLPTLLKPSTSGPQAKHSITDVSRNATAAEPPRLIDLSAS